MQNLVGAQNCLLQGYPPSRSKIAKGIFLVAKCQKFSPGQRTPDINERENIGNFLVSRYSENHQVSRHHQRETRKGNSGWCSSPESFQVSGPKDERQKEKAASFREHQNPCLVSRFPPSNRDREGNLLGTGSQYSLTNPIFQ